MECEPFETWHQLAEHHRQRRSPHALSDEQPTITSNEASDEHHVPQAPIQKSADDEGTNARMLREVAQITAQSFQSTQEAMDVTLKVIGKFLECQTLFITRFEERGPNQASPVSDESLKQNMLKIIAAHNTALPALVAGSEEILESTYCQTIYRTGQPLLVEDAQHHPLYQHLAVTERYDIGFYLGVPLMYSDGRLYGTLCSQDPRPHALAEYSEKVELMQIMARFLISHIERDELIAQVRAAEKAQADLARKEQQARLEANQRVRELQAIFDAIGDGLLVCDQHGQLQMNAAAYRLLPTPERSIQGLIDMQSKEALILSESGQPLAMDLWPIMRVLRGERLIGENVATIQRVNAQGEKRYLSVSGTPMYDQTGRVNGGVCVFRDVTERYLLERRTHETLNSLLTVAESLAWLPENASEFFSAAPSHQTASLSLAYQQLTQLISTLLQCQGVEIISLEPDTATWHLQEYYDADRARGSSWWQEIIQRVTESSTHGSDMDRLRNNEIIIQPLRAQPEADMPVLVEVPMFVGNRLLGMLALVYGQSNAALTPTEYPLAKAVARLTGLVYERERLLQEQAEGRAHALALQETNQRFNEFLGIASHELKGPLSALKINVQLAQRMLRKQEADVPSDVLKKLHRYLESIDDQIRIQNRLTTDLLDVSRIRAGKLNLQMQRCDLTHIVRASVNDQRQMAEGRTITLDIASEEMIVWGDMDRLRQVVNNYLSNALKYSPFDEPVDVSVKSESAEIRVTVSDRGSGLELDEQKRIWERFYRAKDVRVLSGSGIGLGLGLHICKTIIEQHGGQVGLTSTPGQGSHFWFTLPFLEHVSS